MKIKLKKTVEIDGVKFKRGESFTVERMQAINGERCAVCLTKKLGLVYFVPNEFKPTIFSPES